jgi:DNA-3-methyladenine glycosylase
MRAGDEAREGLIVEVEAYDGVEDAASHARFGRTGRNGVMFGPPGRAYVYLVYGMHDCLNIVAGPDGTPSAVLIRAVQPVAGIAAMRAARIERLSTRRSGSATAAADVASARDRIEAIPEAHLARGPGLVAAAFSITRSDSGLDLLDPSSPLRVELPSTGSPTSRDAPRPERPVVATARIGIGYAAEPWRSLPWRLFDADSPSVSGPRSRS